MEVNIKNKDKNSSDELRKIMKDNYLKLMGVHKVKVRKKKRI